MSTTKSFIYEIQQQISQVFMNKQSWKRLKRRKHENAVEDHLISLHLDAVSSLLSIPPGYLFSLSSSLSHYFPFFLCFSSMARGSNQLFGHQLQHPQFISVLFCVIGPWLPWWWHWLWVLEVGHHNCWDGQPADRTESEKTSYKECDFSFKVTLKHYSLNSLLPNVNEFLLQKNIGVWHIPLNP